MKMFRQDCRIRRTDRDSWVWTPGLQNGEKEVSLAEMAELMA